MSWFRNKYKFTHSIGLGAILGTLILLCIPANGIFLIVPLNNNIEINIGDLLTIIVLFLTFLSILWYSQETKELKEVTIKRPCLSFNVKYYYTGQLEGVLIKNYGEGVAMDLQIILNDNVIYKVPLIHGQNGMHRLIDKGLPLPMGKLLNKYKDKIELRYYDQSRKTLYTSIIKLSVSNINGDGCELISYCWK